MSKKARQHSSASLSGEQIRGNFLTIPITGTVEQSIAHIRKSAQRGDIFYLYVVDNQQRLRGVVSIRSLLLASNEETVANLIFADPVYIDEKAPLTEIYQKFASSRFLSLPVLNAERRMVGVLHAHELISDYSAKPETLFEERSRGQLFELLGVKAEDSKANPGKAMLGRLPWLLVNVIGGALCAVFISHFGEKLTNAVQFLALVPVLLVISESVGMQSTSLTIARLHKTGNSRGKNSIALRELIVAALLGLSGAILVSGAAYFWYHSRPQALAVGATIFLGSLWVSFLGNIVPFLVHRLKVDPRISAGPVVLALADSSTLLIYLGLAFLFIHFGII